MADYPSSLPIRTETSGDAAVKIVDGTITSQALSVDSSGKVTTKINDGAGNSLASSTTAPVGTEQALITRNIPSGTQTISGTVAATQSGNWSQRLQDGAGNNITSQANGAQRALDVGVNVAGVQIDPRSIRALTSADIVTANIKDSSGASFSASNPLPVSISSDVAGIEVSSYQTNASIAASATSNHDYTVTALKTLILTQIIASASGKAKIEMQAETGVATNVFTTIAVLFNSTSNPNMEVSFKSPRQIAAGVRVRVIRTNLDKAAQDLYSTILGQEV